jgi:hypothetical protein
VSVAKPSALKSGIVWRPRVAPAAAQSTKSRGEQVCLLDTARLAVIERFVQHLRVPVELVHLLFRWWEISRSSSIVL